MFQRMRVEEDVLPIMREMFAQLGEPLQVLTANSDRPLVVHRIMGQMTMVDRGDGIISVDGEVIPLSAGDLYIIAAGTPHSFCCTSEELHLWHWHWPQHLLDSDREVLIARVAFGLEGRLDQEM